MIWSVIDQSNLFHDLEEAMQGSNYVPFITAWSFETDSGKFTFDELEKINNEPWSDGKTRPLRGKLELDNFQIAVETINNYLSYLRAEASPSTPQEIGIAKNRVATFWKIVKEFFPIDSTTPQTYQHFPEKETRFHMGILWDCVYIFIANNKGFLVAMGAYD